MTVPERMLSLAIGREGQNARLAAKLTGWRIDIRSDQAKPTDAPAVRRQRLPRRQPRSRRILSQWSRSRRKPPSSRSRMPRSSPSRKAPTQACCRKTRKAAPPEPAKAADEAGGRARSPTRSPKPRRSLSWLGPRRPRRARRTRSTKVKAEAGSECRLAPIAPARPVAAAQTYPTRTCVACRTERQKRDFVRIVRAPDGTVALDRDRPGHRPRRLPVRRRLVLADSAQEEVIHRTCPSAFLCRRARALSSSLATRPLSGRRRYVRWLVVAVARATRAARASPSADRTSRPTAASRRSSRRRAAQSRSRTRSRSRSSPRLLGVNPRTSSAS